jgi:hypothetical protein
MRSWPSWSWWPFTRVLSASVSDEEPLNRAIARLSDVGEAPVAAWPWLFPDLLACLRSNCHSPTSHGGQPTSLACYGHSPLDSAWSRRPTTTTSAN